MRHVVAHTKAAQHANSPVAELQDKGMAEVCQRKDADAFARSAHFQPVTS